MKKLFFAIILLPSLLLSCTKDDNVEFDFDYNINYLFGNWRITHVWLEEEAGGGYVDITTPTFEQIVEPTFLKFNNKGIIKMKGATGENESTFITKNKKVIILTYGVNFELDVIALNNTTMEILVDTKGFNIDIPIPDNIDYAKIKLTMLDCETCPDKK